MLLVRHILSAQTDDPASRTLYLLQNFGPLLGFLQQIFRVTCSFIKNGLRGKKKHRLQVCFVTF